MKTNNLSVCFIILHYMVMDETVSSVESILNKVKGNKKIVIVDNGSSNGSGIKLQDKYKDNDDVVVIISQENLGFANGNNLGYRFAKKEFNSDYIVVMNNDVEIYQEDFIIKIDKIYKREKYAILSPDVYSTFSKIHQSPKKLSSFTYDDIVRECRKYKFRRDSKVIIPIKCLLKEIKPLKRYLQNKKFNAKNIDYAKVYYDVPIHGSCMIFSKDFISKRENCFFDKTFMYFESEILDYECHRDHLKVVYDPSVKVNHHHSISASKSYNSELKRERFVNKCVYDSLVSFIDLMDRDKELVK